jgi:hypothetical protein
LKPRLNGLWPQNLTSAGAWYGAIWEPAKAGFADALAHPIGAASAASQSGYNRRATMKDASARAVPPKSSSSATVRRISPVVGPGGGAACVVSGVPELVAGIVAETGGEDVAVAALSVAWGPLLENVCVGDGMVPPLAVPPAPAGFGPPNCDWSALGAFVL